MATPAWAGYQDEVKVTVVSGHVKSIDCNVLPQSFSGNETDGYTIIMPTSHVVVDVTFSDVDWRESAAGTESDPYLITTTEEWETFCEYVNNGSNFSGKYVKLAADINATTSVGFSGFHLDNLFKGTFLGNGHTITMALEGMYNNGTDGTAPFRYITDATIKDLTVAGEIIGWGGDGGRWALKRVYDYGWPVAHWMFFCINNQGGDWRSWGTNGYSFTITQHGWTIENHHNMSDQSEVVSLMNGNKAGTWQLVDGKAVPVIGNSTLFEGVTMSRTTANAETDYIDFVGTYLPVSIYTEEKTNLYLGADNTLYYPATTNVQVNAFRGYFQLKQGLTVGESSAHAIVLNFGDATTGIKTIDNLTIDNLQFEADGWFSLDGRKLDGKPTQRGIYINNGRKVVIK